MTNAATLASLAVSGALSADSSGNVGIGTSSPGAKLAVTASSGTIGNFESTQSATNANLLNLNATQTNSSAGVRFQVNSGTTAQARIQVNGDSSIVFQQTSSDTERARIDTSGNLLVGNASQVWDERLSARNSTNTVVAGFYAQSTSYTSSVIRAQAETAAGTGWYLFEGRSSAGTFQYGIRGNGTVATSDERRKKNVEPARSYLADVCSIPVVKYNWKSDEDDAPKELGWLAQDVAKVFPNMVVTHHDGQNDDQEVLLLKKEVFLPMLMKCIQEQQQMIETLQAKVAALEAK